MIYAKQELTVEGQADQLIARGLIADRDELIGRLTVVNYYRLSGYLYPFRIQDASGNLTDTFASGTTMDMIWRRYNFDRRLRIILLDAIERIEVAVRTRLVYHFVHFSNAAGQTLGPFGHLDPRNLPNFKQRTLWKRCWRNIKSQVEQITIALIYKFMDDMDAESEELGGKRKFFTGEYARYGWAKLMAPSLGGHEMLGLYGEGISKMPENPGIPALFRDIFKNAYLPYRDPETLKSFLKIIDEFSYDHSERLGDAFEYLLSVLGSQGDAGQFRTPRHIIDFMVEVLAPQNRGLHGRAPHAHRPRRHHRPRGHQLKPAYPMSVENKNSLFTIRLTGEGVRPHLIPASDLAELMVAAEQTVLAIAIREHPDEAENLVVGLSQIKDESIGFAFACNRPERLRVSDREIKRLLQPCSGRLHSSAR